MDEPIYANEQYLEEQTDHLLASLNSDEQTDHLNSNEQTDHLSVAATAALNSDGYPSPAPEFQNDPTSTTAADGETSHYNSLQQQPQQQQPQGIPTNGQVVEMQGIDNFQSEQYDAMILPQGVNVNASGEEIMEGEVGTESNNVQLSMQDSNNSSNFDHDDGEMLQANNNNSEQALSHAGTGTDGTGTNDGGQKQDNNNNIIMTGWSNLATSETPDTSNSTTTPDKFDSKQEEERMPDSENSSFIDNSETSEIVGDLQHATLDSSKSSTNNSDYPVPPTGMENNSRLLGEQHSMPDSSGNMPSDSGISSSIENGETLLQTSSSLQPLAAEIIELLDDDEDNKELSDDDKKTAPPSRVEVDESVAKRPRLASNGDDAAAAAYAARYAHLPDWMTKKIQKQGNPIPIPSNPSIRPSTSTSSGPSNNFATYHPVAVSKIEQMYHPPQQPPPPPQRPIYVDLPNDFKPSWESLIPKPKLIPKPPPQKEFKLFELSLLNVSEFTLTGLPVTFEGPPSSISGLRVPIKKISKGYGKAVFERGSDADTDSAGTSGRWRIPLVGVVPFRFCSTYLLRK
jgi:hypothetical protein